MEESREGEKEVDQKPSKRALDGATTRRSSRPRRPRKWEEAPVKLSQKRPRWSPEEKLRLLRVLERKSAETQFDTAALRREVGTRKKAEVAIYMESLRKKAVHAKIESMKKRSPIEIWNDLLRDFGDFDRNCLVSISKAIMMAGVEKTTQPDKLKMDDFRPARIYQYLAALIRGTETPRLTPLESQIVLDCFQHLIEKLKESEIKNQMTFLHSQYTTLCKKAFKGRAPFKGEYFVDIASLEATRLLAEGGDLLPNANISREDQPGTSQTGAGDSAGAGMPEDRASSPQGSTSWRGKFDECLETLLLNPLCIPEELLDLKPREKHGEPKETRNHDEGATDQARKETAFTGDDHQGGDAVDNDDISATHGNAVSNQIESEHAGAAESNGAATRHGNNATDVCLTGEDSRPCSYGGEPAGEGEAQMGAAQAGEDCTTQEEFMGQDDGHSEPMMLAEDRTNQLATAANLASADTQSDPAISATCPDEVGSLLPQTERPQSLQGQESSGLDGEQVVHVSTGSDSSVQGVEQSDGNLPNTNQLNAPSQIPLITVPPPATANIGGIPPSYNILDLIPSRQTFASCSPLAPVLPASSSSQLGQGLAAGGLSVTGNAGFQNVMPMVAPLPQPFMAPNIIQQVTPVLQPAAPIISVLGGGVFSQPASQLLRINLSQLGPNSNIVIPASALPGGVITVKAPEVPSNIGPQIQEPAPSDNDASAQSEVIPVPDEISQPCMTSPPKPPNTLLVSCAVTAEQAESTFSQSLQQETASCSGNLGNNVSDMMQVQLSALPLADQHDQQQGNISQLDPSPDSGMQANLSSCSHSVTANTATNTSCNGQVQISHAVDTSPGVIVSQSHTCTELPPASQDICTTSDLCKGSSEFSTALSTTEEVMEEVLQTEKLMTKETEIDTTVPSDDCSRKDAGMVALQSNTDIDSSVAVTPVTYSIEDDVVPRDTLSTEVAMTTGGDSQQDTACQESQEPLGALAMEDFTFDTAAPLTDSAPELAGMPSEKSSMPTSASGSCTESSQAHCVETSVGVTASEPSLSLAALPMDHMYYTTRSECPVEEESIQGSRKALSTDADIIGLSAREDQFLIRGALPKQKTPEDELPCSDADSNSTVKEVSSPSSAHLGSHTSSPDKYCSSWVSSPTKAHLINSSAERSGDYAGRSTNVASGLEKFIVLPWSTKVLERKDQQRRKLQESEGEPEVAPSSLQESTTAEGVSQVEGHHQIDEGSNVRPDAGVTKEQGREILATKVGGADRCAVQAEAEKHDDPSHGSVSSSDASSGELQKRKRGWPTKKQGVSDSGSPSEEDECTRRSHSISQPENITVAGVQVRKRGRPPKKARMDEKGPAHHTRLLPEEGATVVLPKSPVVIHVSKSGTDQKRRKPQECEGRPEVAPSLLQESTTAEGINQVERHHHIDEGSNSRQDAGVATEQGKKVLANKVGGFDGCAIQAVAEKRDCPSQSSLSSSDASSGEMQKRKRGRPPKKTRVDEKDPAHNMRPPLEEGATVVLPRSPVIIHVSKSGTDQKRRKLQECEGRPEVATSPLQESTTAEGISQVEGNQHNDEGSNTRPDAGVTTEQAKGVLANKVGGVDGCAIQAEAEKSDDPSPGSMSSSDASSGEPQKRKRGQPPKKQKASDSGSPSEKGECTHQSHSVSQLENIAVVAAQVRKRGRPPKKARLGEKDPARQTRLPPAEDATLTLPKSPVKIHFNKSGTGVTKVPPSTEAQNRGRGRPLKRQREGSDDPTNRHGCTNSSESDNAPLFDTGLKSKVTPGRGKVLEMSKPKRGRPPKRKGDDFSNLSNTATHPQVSRDEGTGQILKGERQLADGLKKSGSPTRVHMSLRSPALSTPHVAGQLGICKQSYELSGSQQTYQQSSSQQSRTDLEARKSQSIGLISMMNSRRGPQTNENQGKLPGPDMKGASTTSGESEVESPPRKTTVFFSIKKNK